MKIKGISRKVDDLGRIVIPKEMRRALKWDEKELLDITEFGKYVLVCAHRDNEEQLHETNGLDDPIRKEIIKILGTLSADDILCVHQLLLRLERPLRTSSGADE